MALSPIPPDNNAGGASPDHLADFVNRNNYIPMWLHPHVAHGVLQHFGRDGRAVIHPHPSTTGATGYASGGVVNFPQIGLGRGIDMSGGGPALARGGDMTGGGPAPAIGGGL